MAHFRVLVYRNATVHSDKVFYKQNSMRQRLLLVTMVSCCQGNQQNRAMMLNSKVVDYINYILRAAEFKNCDSEKVWYDINRHLICRKAFDTSQGIWYVARHLMCRKAFDVSLGIWCVARHLMCRKAFGMSQGIWHLMCRKAFDVSQGIWHVARHLTCRTAFDMSHGIWRVTRHLTCR